MPTIQADDFRDEKAYKLAEKIRRRNMARVQIDSLDAIVQQRRTEQAVFVIEKEQRKLIAELAIINKRTAGVNILLPSRNNKRLPPLDVKKKFAKLKRTDDILNRVSDLANLNKDVNQNEDTPNSEKNDEATSRVQISTNSDSLQLNSSENHQNTTPPVTNTPLITVFESIPEMPNQFRDPNKHDNKTPDARCQISEGQDVQVSLKKPQNLTHRNTSNLSIPHLTKKSTHPDKSNPNILPSPTTSHRLPQLGVTTDPTNKPDIPISKYNGDGSLRTRYKLPDPDASFYGASKTRHVRAKEKRWFEKELSISEIFQKKEKANRLSNIVLAKGLVSRKTTPREKVKS